MTSEEIRRDLELRHLEARSREVAGQLVKSADGVYSATLLGTIQHALVELIRDLEATGYLTVPRICACAWFEAGTLHISIDQTPANAEGLN